MPVNFPGNVLTCSGPKGRGFESRHFDRTENPGSVRLPGLFLFPAICGKAGENVEKLGETSGHKSREPLKNNGSRMGELGENIPAALVKRPDPLGDQLMDPQRDQPAEQLMGRR